MGLAEWISFGVMLKLTRLAEPFSLRAWLAVMLP